MATQCCSLLADHDFRHETMLAFLALLQDKYEGVESYLKKYIDLSGEDIETIRNNILVPTNPHL